MAYFLKKILYRLLLVKKLSMPNRKLSQLEGRRRKNFVKQFCTHRNSLFSLKYQLKILQVFVNLALERQLHVAGFFY